MKFIIPLLFLCVSSVLVPNYAQETEETPGEVQQVFTEELPAEALLSIGNYLDAIRLQGSLEWEDVLSLTAVSPFMGKKRKEQLGHYQQAVKIWLDDRTTTSEGRLQWETFSLRREGDMGAAILFLFKTDNMVDVGILPVMLFKDAGNWRPAPFLSTFDNTILPMDPELRRQADLIEKWGSGEVQRISSTAVEMAEKKLDDAFKAIRAGLDLGKSGPEDLLKIWLDAMKKGDVLTVAAISEIPESHELTSAERLAQASYVNNKASLLSLARILSSPTVITAVTDKDEDSVFLGIWDMEQKFPSRNFIAGYRIRIKDYPGGEGKILLLPHDFKMGGQISSLAELGESDEDIDEMRKKILVRFLDDNPQKTFDTPLELAEALAEMVSRPNLTIGDFLVFMDRGSIEEDLKKNISFTSSINRNWMAVKKSWDLFNKFCKNNPETWSKEITKATRLVDIDDDTVLFFLSWFGVDVPSNTFGDYSFILTRKNGRWVYGEEKSIPNFAHHKHEFYIFVRELPLIERRKTYNVLTREQLPEIPSRNLQPDDIQDADEELIHYLEERFSEGLENFILSRKGFIIDTDKGPNTWAHTWKVQKTQYPGAIPSPVWFKNEKAPQAPIVWSAVQKGDWGSVAVALRDQKNPLLMIFPLVRIDGKWDTFHTTIQTTGRGKDIMKPVRNFGSNRNSLHEEVDTRVYEPMMNVLIAQRLLPEDAYHLVDERE